MFRVDRLTSTVNIMKQFTGLLVAIFCYTISISSAQFPTYRCEIADFWNTTCAFSDLKLTRTNYRFIPEAVDFNVREVQIIPPSVVPIIGPDICISFINLKVFRVEPNIGAEAFAPNAFEACQYVDELQMTEQPNIREISRQLFAPMKWMQYLNWTHSEIEEWPTDVFVDLETMWHLTWRQGKLRSLSADQFRNFKRMNILDIESNELSDVNIEGILATCPNLEYVWLDDNPIRCSRLAVIKQALRARQITPQPARSPKPDRVVKLVKDNEGLLCLPD